jgi:hypothetical protein
LRQPDKCVARCPDALRLGAVVNGAGRAAVLGLKTRHVADGATRQNVEGR